MLLLIFWLWEKEPQPGDFPGGPVVKNLPSKAEDGGSLPGRGTKIPHDRGQLSLCAPTKIPHATTKTRRSQVNIYI